MTTFVVYNKQTGAEVTRYEADQPIEWAHMEFATHDHIAQPKPAGEAVQLVPVYAGERELTPRQFRDLFTEEEKNAIDELRAHFEAMPIPDQVKKRIRSGFADYDASRDINLDDPRVPMLLGVFVGFGCISYNRIDEVING